MARSTPINMLRQFLDVQRGALRWTFLASAIGNRNFLAILASLSDEAVARVELAARSCTPAGSETGPPLGKTYSRPA